MDRSTKIQDIAKSLRKILSELDELEQPMAAIKISEAINAISNIDSVSEYEQDI